MIIPSTVGRCWMALLLVLATLAFLTQSSPIHKRNVSGKTKWCGPEFSKALEAVCAVYKSYWLPTPAEPTEVGNDLKPQKELENRRSPTTNECCLVGCTQKDLESFCQEVRNQTTVELPKSSDLSAANVMEWISQPSEPLSTTETPSDSTPEIFYNESLEQDALTILPTYRTPQYSNLQFL
ncbi:uncharacterized protein LOC124195950 isoform X1 [Daphnia pulex]|uniref:uncharacterized protein LOC124195950 isoform X1 n=1 Tax=Daphnia pulex TaxID=6669 RepID=UPI001EE0A23C|nr:uncharacterized protein LOC124195950 isoform X1 [Daphnia pulex]